MKNKEEVLRKKEILISLLSEYCKKKLDDDYQSLCIKMINKMARKHNVPFLKGRIEIWASAIIYALGSINFLFDKSFEPYLTGDDISEYFNTSKSTTSQKAKIIKDMFKLGYYNREFSTQKMDKANPFNDLMMVDGYIVSK